MSQAGETDDVQSPGLGTVCHVSEPDVLRGDAACIRVGVVPLGCNQYRPFRRLLVSTVRHTTWRLWDYGGRWVLPGLYRFCHVTIVCGVWNVFQKFRVPTDREKQGKQGKWLKIIPCREKSGNLKILFNIRENTGNLKISKNIRENTGNLILPRINFIENVVDRA